ncbi:MAG TPA: 3'-5' exonuclease, partial [Bacillota bacterium]|nr:3'-5' exonuclease [Bacillota bacterium]
QMVIQFINELSQGLFAGENFKYEALEAQAVNLGSRIELVYSGERDLQGQARMVARRIAQLVRESQNTDCPIHYRDIVLLFRASTAMPLFQRALQELGIPFFAAGGGNFYQRQEVADQINLLSLVQQRFDGVALAGLLTSPYVGLSEESLFWLSNEQSLVEEFYSLACPHPEISLPEMQRLERFRELIIYLQENRDLLDIPEIIRLALEQMNYRELLWSMPNAGQRLANLEKLLLKADQFIEKGYHSLTAFLGYIKELEAMEVVESEAQTQAEASDVVRLMTIHRSKGLEFPVVILPDLDRRFPVAGSERLIFHKEVGIGFKIPLENTEDGETSLWKRIRQLNKAEETAELKRVLYVALTRAKCQLLLFGSGAGTAKGETLETANNWMRWLELLLPVPEADTAVCDFNGIPLQITREIPDELQPEPPQLLLETYAKQFDSPTLEAQTEVAAAVNRALPVVNLKVSGILTFKECPRRFYLQYGLHLPEGKLMPHTAAIKHPTDASGTQIGIFLHQAVRQRSPVWPETLWQQTFGNLPPGQAGRLKQELTQMWDNFCRSEYGQQVGECWDEVPFQLKLDPNLRVEGRFDRLLQNHRGELVLVDYKTHRAGPERVEQVAPYYFWQLQLYALAVEAVWGRKPDRAVLYFVYPDLAVPVPLDGVALEATVQDVRRIGRFVAEHRQLTDFPLLEKDQCAECPYGWFCWK